MLIKKLRGCLATLAAASAVMIGVAAFPTDTAAADAAAAPTAAPTPIPVASNQLPGWPQMSEIEARSAIVMDADTGAILYSKLMDEKRYPASITKIMTCLLALENSSMDDIVTFTEEGIKEAYAGSSNCVPVLGEEFTMEQALNIMMLKSANDMATQIGVQIGGSVEGFTQMMNDRAAQLGCTGTHFNNSNGLPDENHYSTAHDFALIMQECIKNDDFRRITSTAVVTIPPTNKTSTERIYQNHCALVVPNDSRYYEYCIGGKTGYTDSAWRTLVSAAEKDGRRLVCVTMKCATKQDFPDTVALFEYGFNNFSVQEVNRTVDGYKETGKVTLPVNATIDNTWTKDDGNGKLTYYYEDQVVGYGERTKESIFSGKDDKKDNGTTDTVEGQDVSAQGEASDSPVTEETKRSGSGLLIIISILLVLLIIIFAIHMRIQREKRRLRKRKRRRNKKEE
jgi:D-alanyl-D-alanine carboxypeptidase